MCNLPILVNGFNGGWFMDIWPLIVSWVVDWCVVERFMIDIFLIGTFLFDRCKIDGFNGGWFMDIRPLIVS
jgi:hypothetical protein